MNTGAPGYPPPGPGGYPYPAPGVYAPPPAAPAPLPAPPAPAKKGLVERVLRDPNAIWMREMRQSARLGRTPWVVFSITLALSLLMCSIGGIAAATDAAPANIGSALFQVFFSMAFLVVVLAGPAIAANGIASEREGKTWEAVLLTGLTAKQIARGKFLAAFTTISLYIVALAPVGALSFLFGGVTATEVVVAFVFLFLLAGLSVAFGLAVSSLMSSLRGAIVVTLALAICVGPLLYFFFGFLCSFGIHKLWPEVPEGFPIWLPLAYSRAKVGPEYFTFLVALPLLAIGAPAWFLYEVSVANLTGEAEDRSSGLKRWFTVITPLMAVACAIPSAVVPEENDRAGFAVLGMSFFALHLTFCALLFAFEPPGPSRRVRIHWARDGAGALGRFFGPGLGKTSLLVIVVGVLGTLFIAFSDMAVIALGTAVKKETYLAQVFLFATYAAPFFVFVVGLVGWLRSRGNTPWVTRLITFALLFLITAGPWIIAAIGGVMARGSGDDWLVIGAPSPIYAVFMIAWVEKTTHTSSMPIVEVGVLCALLWAVTGLLLTSLAARRCAKIVRQHDEAVSQAEAALKAEEDAMAAAAPTADAPEPAPQGQG